MSPICIGIGAGPANLSLACQLQEEVGTGAVFLDSQSSFRWHRGIAFDFSELQVSHFKDLVTLVNPRSAYTFVNYLHENGRLYHFLNARFDAILRAEFESYLNWAFHKNPLVRSGETVREIGFEGGFIVRTDTSTYTSKNIVLGIGKQARIPNHFREHLGNSLFHASSYQDIEPETRAKRICVVGGGQSGAEVFQKLVSLPVESRPASIAWVSRRDNFLPMDDSPFTNELFMPCFSDRFAAMADVQRKLFLKRFVLASDGISEKTLRAIYQALYRLEFLEPQGPSVILRPACSVSHCVADGEHYRLTLESYDERLGELEADIVILATGYENGVPNFLCSIADRIELADGEMAIREDFSVRWDGPSDARIFVQNASLGQRGLADPNLSLLAWRARRVLDSLLGGQSASARERSGFITQSLTGGKSASSALEMSTSL